MEEPKKLNKKHIECLHAMETLLYNSTLDHKTFLENFEGWDHWSDKEITMENLKKGFYAISEEFARIVIEGCYMLTEGGIWKPVWDNMTFEVINHDDPGIVSNLYQLVRSMDVIVKSFNDEEATEYWLQEGVPDGFNWKDPDIDYSKSDVFEVKRLLKVFMSCFTQAIFEDNKPNYKAWNFVREDISDEEIEATQCPWVLEDRVA